MKKFNSSEIVLSVLFAIVVGLALLVGGCSNELAQPEPTEEEGEPGYGTEPVRDYDGANCPAHVSAPELRCRPDGSVLEVTARPSGELIVREYLADYCAPDAPAGTLCREDGTPFEVQ